jgi:hypothetical protein
MLKFKTVYNVVNTQTGDWLYTFNSTEDAEKKLLELENEDIKNDNYCPDMYVVQDNFEVIK